jgi:hypothetical protein
MLSASIPSRSLCSALCEHGFLLLSILLSLSSPFLLLLLHVSALLSYSSTGVMNTPGFYGKQYIRLRRQVVELAGILNQTSLFALRPLLCLALDLCRRSVLRQLLAEGNEFRCTGKVFPQDFRNIETLKLSQYVRNIKKSYFFGLPPRSGSSREYSKEPALLHTE